MLNISSLEAKYSNAKATIADKQTKADGSVTYEVAFERSGQKHEATFRPSGEFVEEE